MSAKYMMEYGPVMLTKAEYEEMIVALRFYADPANYHAVYDPQNDYWFAILDDEGARARAVLPEYQQKGTKGESGG
jgi:hypothetical protein